MNFYVSSEVLRGTRKRGEGMAKTRQRGFSLPEVSIVIAILFILIAVAVPVLMTTVRSARLRGAANDFSALLQQARMRSVQDDRYYSVLPVPPTAIHSNRRLNPLAGFPHSPREGARQASGEKRPNVGSRSTDGPETKGNNETS